MTQARSVHAPPSPILDRGRHFMELALLGGSIPIRRRCSCRSGPVGDKLLDRPCSRRRRTPSARALDRAAGSTGRSPGKCCTPGGSRHPAWEDQKFLVFSRRAYPPSSGREARGQGAPDVGHFRRRCQRRATHSGQPADSTGISIDVELEKELTKVSSARSWTGGDKSLGTGGRGQSSRGAGRRGERAILGRARQGLVSEAGKTGFDPKRRNESGLRRAG